MTISYKLHKRAGESEVSAIIKSESGSDRVVSFPLDEDCNYYREYLEWKAIDGNEPIPAD